MAEKLTLTIDLTREQQFEILAATGLFVRTVEIDPASSDEAGAAAARLPLPEWLKRSTVAVV